MITIRSIQNTIKQRRDEKQVLEMIPVSMIKPNPYQPRKVFRKQSLDELLNQLEKWL